MTEQITYKCPDPNCKCFFFTQVDLDKHLAIFGETHAQALKEMHQKLDTRYNSMEWSEADQWISDFEKIIREHYNLPQRRYK